MVKCLGTSGIDNPSSRLVSGKSALLHVHPCLYNSDAGDISPGVCQEIGSESTWSVRSTEGCGCRIQKYCGHADKGSRDFLSRSIFFSFSHLRTLRSLCSPFPSPLSLLQALPMLKLRVLSPYSSCFNNRTIISLGYCKHPFLFLYICNCSFVA